MKVFIISSASFYDRIAPIKEYLESKKIEVILPNTYDNPNLEKEVWEKGFKEHAKLEKELFKMSDIEIYEAFKNNKKIYLYHDIPKGMLYDEIAGFDPIVINENLDLII